MILLNGELLDDSAAALDRLPDVIEATLSAPPLETETVVAALDAMADKLASGAFDQLVTDPMLRAHVRDAVGMLRRDALEARLTAELGERWMTPYAPSVPPGHRRVQIRPVPLGTVLHIAAGNMDAIPAFSVIEGLLTGNVNLLKLPKADRGLTVRFFRELIAIEPRLAGYVHVFDTPSTDLAAMRRLIALADGIAVWGGDAAVQAVRQAAHPGCKLIEWGHRLSFCYCTDLTAQGTAFQDLARHIVTTRGLLCSSCQVIYLDTDDMADVRQFCTRFLPVLEAAAAALPPEDDGTAAALTLRQYTASIEQDMFGTADDVFRGHGCALTVCEDSALTLSPLYGNVLVKRLPRGRMLPTLREARGYLQTAGLICADAERAALTDSLLRCGLTRVVPPARMSEMALTAPHDGELPLRRYVRYTEVE